MNAYTYECIAVRLQYIIGDFLFNFSISFILAMSFVYSFQGVHTVEMFIGYAFQIIMHFLKKVSLRAMIGPLPEYSLSSESSRP